MRVARLAASAAGGCCVVSSTARAVVLLGCSILCSCGATRGTVPEDARGGDRLGDDGGGPPPPACNAPGEVPFLWARQIGAGSTTAGFAALAVASDGSYFVTGTFSGHLDLGLGERTETRFDSALNSDDIWVAHFTRDASLVWARQAGGTLADGPLAAALADDGLVVAGKFAGTAVFGSDEPGEAQLRAAGEQDAFVALYQLDGQLGWARRIGGTRGTGQVAVGQVLAANDGSA